MSDTVTYTLTFEEIQSGLWKTRRPLSKIVPQTVLLLVLGLPSLWYAITKGGDAGSLLLGIALPLLAAAVWVIPAVSFQKEAKKLAEQGLSVTLTLSETALLCGDVTVPLSGAVILKEKDLLIWKVDRDWSIFIPRRVLGDAAWAHLCSFSE